MLKQNNPFISDDLDLLKDIIPHSQISLFLLQSLSNLLEIINYFGSGIFNALPNYDDESLQEAFNILQNVRDSDNHLLDFLNELKKSQDTLGFSPEIIDKMELEEESMSFKHLDDLILHIANEKSERKKTFKRTAEVRGNYQVIKGRDRMFYHAVLKKVMSEKSQEEAKRSIVRTSRMLGINRKTAGRIIQHGPFRKQGAGRKIQNPQLEERMVIIIKKLVKAGRPPSRTEARVLAGHYRSEITKEDHKKEKEGFKKWKATKGWLDKFMRRNPNLHIFNQEEVGFHWETIKEALERLELWKEASWFENKVKKTKFGEKKANACEEKIVEEDENLKEIKDIEDKSKCILI